MFQAGTTVFGISGHAKFQLCLEKSTSLASHKGERTEQIQTASGKPSSSHGTGNGFCSLSCSDVTWVRRILCDISDITLGVSWAGRNIWRPTIYHLARSVSLCHENDHAKDAEWYWVSCVNHQRRYPAVWLWICEGAASLEGTLTSAMQHEYFKMLMQIYWTKSALYLSSWQPTTTDSLSLLQKNDPIVSIIHVLQLLHILTNTHHSSEFNWTCLASEMHARRK